MFQARVPSRYYIKGMKALRGMSLIDVIIGTALVSIMFFGIFSALRASLVLSSYIKAEAAASAIANNEMEDIRALPYASVGLVNGIPNGVIPEYATTTADGITFGIQTFIDYYDDPADGTGSNDTNGITQDYKQIKITVSYTFGNATKQYVLASNYAPQGLETTDGGGTLQVLVVNAQGAPVSGATVQIVNSSLSPSVNETAFTNIAGQVNLPGALPSTQYQITVSKSGYSTAQTYARDSTNQNPTPGYLTVVANQTTSSTFAIDYLSTLNLGTYSPVATSTFTDSFADSSKLASKSNIVASGGSLTLSGGAGSYALSGSAVSVATTSPYLVSWGQVNATLSAPSGTSVSVQVVDQNGNPIPDTVLPGNSAGFTSFPVNLAGVSTTTYPTLALSASLSSNSANVTPSISNWSLSMSAGPTPIPNVSFTLTGAKKIGTTGAGAAIYKTTISTTTGSTGINSLSLEYDSYGFSLSGYDITDACGVPPYALSPATTYNEKVILGPQTSNELLVTVTDSSGTPLSGASVTVSRSGYTQTVQTSSCGNAYFGSMSNASDYSISISKSGYTSNSASGISVNGQTLYTISF